MILLFRDMFGVAGFVLEAAGVLVIVMGIALSTVSFLRQLRQSDTLAAYQSYRQNMARSIILGLEFLIAGDIIRTVIVDQTFSSATVLALIVVIRVMLSLTLHFEVEGHWPWQRRRLEAEAAAGCSGGDE